MRQGWIASSQVLLAMTGCLGDLPPKKWTGLNCFLLHLDRAGVADGGMAPGSIVVAFDVGKDIAFGLFLGGVVLMMNEFCLQGVEEALHRGVVIAIGLA